MAIIVEKRSPLQRWVLQALLHPSIDLGLCLDCPQ